MADPPLPQQIDNDQHSTLTFSTTTTTTNTFDDFLFRFRNHTSFSYPNLISFHFQFKQARQKFVNRIKRTTAEIDRRSCTPHGRSHTQPNFSTWIDFFNFVFFAKQNQIWHGLCDIFHLWKTKNRHRSLKHPWPGNCKCRHKFLRQRWLDSAEKRNNRLIIDLILSINYN